MATTTDSNEMHTPAHMYAPAHPGEILRDLYLGPLKISVTRAAEALGISRKQLSKIVSGQAPVTPEMAMRLAVAFSTAPDIWINLQAQHDLWKVKQQPLPKVEVLRAA